MSFILDALKKSESERQKAGAPALYEAKVAPPRRRLPLWLLVLAVLLVINAAGLAWVLLRGSQGTGNAGAAVQPTAGALPGAPGAGPAMTAGGAAPGAPGIGPGSAGSAAVQAAPGVGAASAGPDGAGGPGGIPAAPSGTAAGGAGGTPAGTAGATGAGDISGTGQAPPQDAAQAPAADAAAGPADDDNAPAVEPARGGPAQPAGALSADSIRGLPDYEEAASAAGSTLPALKLDLHAYAPNPADRFIILNTAHQREGDTTSQGIKIEAITPGGVVLSYQGRRYMLQRQ